MSGQEQAPTRPVPEASEPRPAIVPLTLVGVGEEDGAAASMCGPDGC